MILSSVVWRTREYFLTFLTIGWFRFQTWSASGEELKSACLTAHLCSSIRGNIFVQSGQCSNRDIGTFPTEYDNLIPLFSSDSFDLGSLYCYHFLFLAPPNLFLVHSVFFILPLRMAVCTVAVTYNSFNTLASV